MAAEFLTPAVVWIDRIVDKGDHRAPLLTHPALLACGRHAVQKSMDSAGEAKRTTTCSRPPTHDVSMLRSTVELPLSGIRRTPAKLSWVRPDRTSMIDQRYVRGEPVMLWIPNDTSMEACSDRSCLGRL